MAYNPNNNPEIMRKKIEAANNPEIMRKKIEAAQKESMRRIALMEEKLKTTFYEGRVKNLAIGIQVTINTDKTMQFLYVGQLFGGKEDTKTGWYWLIPKFLHEALGQAIVGCFNQILLQVYNDMKIIQEPMNQVAQELAANSEMIQEQKAA